MFSRPRSSRASATSNLEGLGPILCIVQTPSTNNSVTQFNPTPAATERDLAPGVHHCRVCKRKTQWYGTRLQTCEGCGSVFPCTSCDHHDCCAARNLNGVRDWTDVFDGIE